MNRKQLILALIKDDLINSKLVYGLSDLGLDAGCYFLHLSDTIFSLMGFDGNERRDGLYKKYVEMVKKVEYIDISVSNEALEALTLEVYTTLVGLNSELA
ncbi:hypothetical protein WSM22_18580 [Cytophagales bacterium WSM2-2]|nr:hypothetical protein WSM22_18580 [Cytophagales bacterium WSM2-2]